MTWFNFKPRSNQRKTSHCSICKEKFHLERLEHRLLMAADVIWENNAPPAGFVAKVEKGALVFEGSETRDKVLVHDIVANKSQKQLTTGEKYIEIQHQDSQNRLRRGWVKQDNNLSFVFHGKGGDDYFQYIDTTADPAARRDRRIVAYGGLGNDNLHGYTKNDILFGDEGNDDLFGELGSDLLVGGMGNDRLWGDGVTNVHRSQTTDNDYLEGGTGTDQLYGWQGGDVLNGGTYWQINDAAVDELYGGSEADCFYIEKFADPRKNEAKDLSIPQGDKPDAFDELTHPPSYDTWLATYHTGLPPRPMNLAAYPGERKLLASGDGPIFWPNLGTNYEVLGPSTKMYNCIAASVGEYGHDLWSVPTTLSWANDVYRTRGFSGPVAYNSPTGKLLLNDARLETVVVYGIADARAAYQPSGIRITHAAQRTADGTWVSKLGDYALIRHQSAEAVAGGAYCRPLYVYSRPRLGCGCS